jgi:glutathione S-transferase
MLTLHHAPSSRAGRIVWLLEELGLEYTLNRMDFHPSSLKSDEHRARHPLGRVPVLDDDDVSLYESGAIVEYLVARHSDGALKPAVDSPLFPQYLQWFHYVEGMIMPPVNIIVVQTLLLPPERQDKEVLRQAKSLLAKALVPVDAALAGRDYIIGDFSAADIMLGHACYMSRRLLGGLPPELSYLDAYIDRIEQRPAFQTGISA